MVFTEKCKERDTGSADNIRKEFVMENNRAEMKMLRPEKIKLPIFTGNIRNFARFRRDFGKIVVPFYPDPLHRAYVIKENCLKGEAKILVENIEDI